MLAEINCSKHIYHENTKIMLINALDYIDSEYPSLFLLIQ